MAELDYHDEQRKEHKAEHGQWHKQVALDHALYIQVVVDESRAQQRIVHKSPASGVIRSVLACFDTGSCGDGNDRRSEHQHRTARLLERGCVEAAFVDRGVLLLAVCHVRRHRQRARVDDERRAHRVDFEHSARHSHRLVEFFHRFAHEHLVVVVVVFVVAVELVGAIAQTQRHVVRVQIGDDHSQTCRFAGVVASWRWREWLELDGIEVERALDCVAIFGRVASSVLFQQLAPHVGKNRN